MKRIKRLFKLGLGVMLVVSLFLFGHGSGYADDNSVTIKKGDTLYSIAKKYNISVQELKDFNGLTGNTLYTGQKLLIPELYEAQPMYVVVGGSFAKKANAEKQIDFLKKKGIHAVIVKKVINNKNYYRIQTGVFTKKANAEKNKQLLVKYGVKDPYILPQKSLHIGEVQLGSTYEHLLNSYGKPSKTEDHLNIRSLYYQDEGAGVRVNFNMNNGDVFGLQVYPDYVKIRSIPKEKSQVIQEYGYPNEVQQVSCYESATCEQFTYTFNKNKLIIRFDRDRKTVQYLDLSRAQ
jgi:LysM repeat protein